jgi:hypothetical protein
MKEQEEFIEEFLLIIEKIETADCIGKDIRPWLADLCELMKKYKVCVEGEDGIVRR